MKVLLATNQYIDIRKDGCYCDFPLYGTLENMSVLGELHLVASFSYSDEMASIMYLNQKIDFVDLEHVKHLRPTNKSIGGWLKNSIYNRKLLERLVPSMDLVVGYMPSGDADTAMRIARRHEIPFLSFLVACPWDSLHNHHRLLARLMAPISFLTTRYSVRHSDYVHYVTKEFLQRRYPTEGRALGCSDTNFGVFDPMALESRLRKLSSRKETDEVRLITTAHVDVRYKGHEFVIRAIARLKSLGDLHYRYWLIGGGKGDYLRTLCKRLGVEDQVIFLGLKTSKEVMKILKDADIYLQPSLQEGLPRSVVEAMSVALPCIGFNTGGIPELLEPEFVVDQKDVKGIVRCLIHLRDNAKYCQTAERNFQMAGDYEHSKLEKRIRDFFSEVRKDVEDKRI